MQAIAESVMEAFSAAGATKPSVEGLSALQWVLIDGGSVMVHVFLRERREYYTLEKLWHDAPQVALEAA